MYKNALNVLANLTEVLDCKQGDLIVSEGDIVDSIYLIFKGKCDIIKNKVVEGKSENMIVAVLDEGDSIGLSSTGFYSKNMLREASALAISDMILLKMNIDEIFSQFLKKHPIFNQQFREQTEKLYKINFIKKIPPFIHLDSESLFKLVDEVEEISLEDKSIVFNQGDTADCCYLIQEGNIIIYITEADGSEKILCELGPESLFGESSLLALTGTRNASAKSLGEIKLLALEYKFMNNALKKNKDFNQSLLGFMVRQIRPVPKKEVQCYQQIVDGQAVHVLHNTHTNRYYRLSEESLFLWNKLDGEQTIKSLSRDFYYKYQAFVPDMICNLLYRLSEMGFVDMPEMKEVNGEKKSGPNFIEKIKQFSEIEYSFNHVDKILLRIYKKGIYILFTRPFQWFFFLIAILGFIAFIANISNFVATFQHAKPNLLILLLLLFTISISTVILHELGHAFTANKYGFKIRRFAIGWMFAAPIAYADTSELWLANKKIRLIVNIAGVSVDFLMAGFLSLAAYFFIDSPIFPTLWILSFLIYYQGLKNLSPLNEYDGYYLLSDYLESPKLRKLSMQWLANQPLLFSKTYKKEMIFWLACVLYSLISAIFFFFITQLFLGYLIANTLYTLILSLAFTLFVLFGTFNKFRKMIFRMRMEN